VNLEQCRDILGTMSDEAVAARAGCSPRAARRYRIALGIAPMPREYVSALDAMEDAYGILPDRVIADMTGETVAAVARHRYDLVILEPKEWTGEQTAYERVNEWIEIVGAVSDETVASFVGVSASEVTAYREARGFLLECGDSEEVEAPYVERVQGSRVAPFVHLLGTHSDGEIGRMAGVDPSSVRRVRRALGIAPKTSNGERKPLPMRRSPTSKQSLVEAFIRSLGRPVANCEVSEVMGLSSSRTSSLLRSLLNAGRIVRTSFAHHAAPEHVSCPSGN